MEPVTFQPGNRERQGEGFSLKEFDNISYINHSLDPQSTDPFANPGIKVNYFSVDFDLDVQVAACRLSRRILTSQPYRQVKSFLSLPFPILG